MNPESAPTFPIVHNVFERYSKKYDKLLQLAQETGVPVVPLSLENHRTTYSWVHAFVQVEIMQRLYKEEVGVVKNTDQWINRFSKEFNEAFREMIEAHPDLLAKLRNNFEETIEELKIFLRDVCLLEEEVEAGLHLPDNEESRVAVLGMVQKVVREHPDYLTNRTEGPHRLIEQQVERLMKDAEK